MGLTNDKEGLNTFYKGDKVIYILNEYIIRTGTIISTASLAKIKYSLTNIIHLVFFFLTK